MQSAQEAVSFWVPIVSLSLFAIGTSLALSSYVATWRRERAEKRAAAGGRTTAVGAKRLLRLS